MLERLFVLKKGTEVPAQFDGATVPYMVPTSDAEIAALIPDEKSRVAIFNQAHALNVQKAVKAEALEEGQTIEGLRKIAIDHKYGQVRTKGPGTGKPRVKAAQIANVLGDDFLASLSPEQRAKYDAKMAELAAAQAAAPKAAEAPKAEAPKAAAPQGQPARRK